MIAHLLALGFFGGAEEETGEPVTLAEAKAWLRVDVSADDDLIEALIVAAREKIENFTGLTLVRRAIVQTFDSFSARMELYGWPNVGTVTVEYLDSDGSEASVDDARVVSAARPARILPAIATSWPSAYSQPQAIVVTYEAGYSSPEDVPSSLKQAMLFLIAQWYDNRSSVTIGASAAELPFTVEALCRPYRLPTI